MAKMTREEVDLIAELLHDKIVEYRYEMKTDHLMGKITDAQMKCYLGHASFIEQTLNKLLPQITIDKS